jgi:hypothetical protein
MNNKQAKRMRKHIRNITGDMPENVSKVEAVLDNHGRPRQKTHMLPPGTKVSNDNPNIHRIPVQSVLDEEGNDTSPVLIAMDVSQRKLDVCKRKFYQQLKKDIKRVRRSGVMNNA